MTKFIGLCFLCLLALPGCVVRRHADPAPSNPVAHPIQAENHAIKSVTDQAARQRDFCFVLGLLALAATFILRAVAPSFAWIAGAVDGACAVGYVWSLIVTFSAPLFIWLIVAGIVVAAIHWRRWILNKVPAKP